jgi:hypothetical protein
MGAGAIALNQASAPIFRVFETDAPLAQQRNPHFLPLLTQCRVSVDVLHVRDE